MKKLTIKRYHIDYHNHRIPGIICTDSGKIIIYYECRTDGSDWSIKDLAMKSSTDGGETWSEDKVLVYGNGHAENNPMMIADKNVLLFTWQEDMCRTYCRKSYDEGETWSDPVELTHFTKTPLYPWTVIAFGPGHGIVTNTGRYLLPVWLCSNPENPLRHDPSIVSTFHSDDKGDTWQLGELIDEEYLKNPSETVLAQLSDGRILLNSRNESPCKERFTAFSSDGASHWQEKHFEPALPDPTCAAGLTSHNGSLYFSNCCSQTDRRNLTVKRSDDDGQTWKIIAEISDPAGYSDIALSPDGKKIYIFFEEFDGSIEHYDLVFVSLDNPGIPY